VVESVDSYRTPTGARFAAYLEDLDRGPLVIELPDAHPARRLSLHYAMRDHPEVILSFEVAAGANGDVHLLLSGSSDGRNPIVFSGYLSVSPEGEVSEVEPIAGLSSSHDPGSPAHLRVRAGSSQVSLVSVGEECTAVYVRSA
jgi:hypothetical protein